MCRTIYVIVQGDYSDWKIKGYCKTEEEATKICEEYNKRKLRFDDDAYWLPVNDICHSSETNFVEYYKYRVFVVKYDDGDAGFFIECYEERVLLDYVPEKRVEKNFDGRYFIDVFLENDDEERAEKIAKDFWYQNLAEKKEIV